MSDNMTERERFEQKNDSFIRHNNVMKALKLAKKTLMDAISKAVLKFDRSFLNNGEYKKGRILILGRKHCGLLYELIDRGFLEGFEGDHFSNIPPKLIVFNMPVYTSDKDYEIRILNSFGAYGNEYELYSTTEKGLNWMARPGVLFDIDEWIARLPESSKLKKVSEDKK